MKTYLQVPFSSKDRAKELGARYDMDLKRWFVPDGLDVLLFSEWLTEKDRLEFERWEKTLSKKKKISKYLKSGYDYL